MNKPVRIQRKATKGWKMPEGAVYVDRPSYFGNPFPVVKLEKGEYAVGRYLPLDDTGFVARFELFFKGTEAECRAESVKHFEDWLYTAGTLKYLGVWGAGSRFRLRVITELAGKDLCCWCPVGQPCHADALMRLANGSI